MTTRHCTAAAAASPSSPSSPAAVARGTDHNATECAQMTRQLTAALSRHSPEWSDKKSTTFLKHHDEDAYVDVASVAAVLVSSAVVKLKRLPTRGGGGELSSGQLATLTAYVRSADHEDYQGVPELAPVVKAHFDKHVELQFVLQGIAISGEGVATLKR